MPYILMEFPVTVWTLIHKANLNGDATARSALETFCQQYRQPVIHFLRQRGVLENRVEDMAHDFLLQLMERDALRRADPAKGRFRSYLLASLRHFMASDITQQQTAKRGNGARHLNLEAVEHAGEIPDPSGPEVTAHDRAWAVNLVLVSYAALEQECAAKGKLERLNKLKPFILPGGTIPQQSTVAAELGQPEENLRVEISRLRKRFRNHFHDEVARTVGSPEEIADEIRYLREVISHPGVAIS
jgi:DNA-directed RNA polymerase specialized sigma24 family protein